MDAREFRELIDAFGADPARWPSDRRDLALEWQADNHGIAAALLADAAALDRTLDAARAIAPSDLLQARIMASVPRPVFADWRGAAAAAAVMLIAGIAGGYAGGGLFLPAEADFAEDAYYADAFGGLSADWDFSVGDGA